MGCLTSADEFSTIIAGPLVLNTSGSHLLSPGVTSYQVSKVYLFEISSRHHFILILFFILVKTNT